MEAFLTYSPIVFGILVIILLFWVIKLNKRINHLSAGAKGVSLESVIHESHQSIQHLAETQENHKSHIINLQHNILDTIQNIGIVRFKAFNNTGGNQSFAIALTNKRKDGVIISSLFTRERVNVFAKPITNGISTFTLTEEEQNALNQAHKK